MERKSTMNNIPESPDLNSKVPAVSDDFSLFSAIFSNSDFDQIFRINKNRIYDYEDSISLTRQSATLKTRDGTLFLRIDHYDDIKQHRPIHVLNDHVIKTEIDTLNIQFHKFLDYCMIVLKDQTELKRSPTVKESTIYFSIEGFASKCGKSCSKSNLKYIKRELRDLLDVLMLTTVSFKASKAYITKQRNDNKRNRSKDKIVTEFIGHFVSSYTTTNGGFFIFFDPLFTEQLVYSGASYYLTEIMTAQDVSYYIGRKLNSYYRMYGNARKPDQTEFQAKRHIISVEDLLKDCTTLPTVDDVREYGSREFTKRIREPFEKGLDDLFLGTNSDGSKRFPSFKDYFFCKSKSERFTEEELETFSSDFNMFLKSYIHFDLEEAPGYELAVESYQKKVSNAKRQQESAKNRAIGKALADQQIEADKKE